MSYWNIGDGESQNNYTEYEKGQAKKGTSQMSLLKKKKTLEEENLTTVIKNKSEFAWGWSWGDEGEELQRII